MANGVKGNIGGVVGKIKTDINTYKGTETKTAIVKVDNYKKEISVEVKESAKGKNFQAGHGIDITYNESEDDYLISTNEEVQDKLIAGTNIKIEGNVISAVGEGQGYQAGTGITIEDNIVSVDDTIATKHEVELKQDVLISGENIKTINNTSILGEGNLNVGGAGGQPLNYIEIDSSEPQEISLSNATVFVCTNPELESLTLNFPEDYKDTLGWVSEVIFRTFDGSLPVSGLTVNNQEIKYIEYGVRQSGPEWSANSTVDLIFFYDGINTNCYVSEVVMEIGDQITNESTGV